MSDDASKSLRKTPGAMRTYHRQYARLRNLPASATVPEWKQ